MSAVVPRVVFRTGHGIFTRRLTQIIFVGLQFHAGWLAGGMITTLQRRAAVCRDLYKFLRAILRSDGTEAG